MALRFTMDELRLYWGQPASYMRPSTDQSGKPNDSYFGHVALGARGENWPTWDGLPMAPLCQLNLADAPYVPEIVRDIALITVFAAANDGGWVDQTLGYNDPDAVLENGNMWVLRAYPSLNGLVEITQPRLPGGYSSVRVDWELDEANPPCSCLFFKRPEMYERLPVDCDLYDEYFFEGGKLGGWPTVFGDSSDWEPIRRMRERQDTRADVPHYAFQLGCDQGTGLHGGGELMDVMFFARDPSNLSRWVMSWDGH